MRGNRKVDSPPECLLRRELFARGLRYRKNPVLRTSTGVVRPDLAFQGPKVAVFVDGCFWHSCPLHGNVPPTNRGYWEGKLRSNRERDERVSRALAADDWLVIRIWEHEPLVAAAGAVETAIRKRAKPRASMS